MNISILKIKVIKFFHDKNVVKKKHNRSKLFSKFLPSSISIKSNFLLYDYYEGNLLVNEKSSKKFKKIIDELFEIFWIKKNLNKFNLNQFYQECNKFYKIKTFARVNSYLSKKLNMINFITLMI